MSIIEEKDMNALRFALELIIAQTITVLSLLFIAYSINRIVETILYIVVFATLRRIIQGYHAKTFLKCYILTMSNYILIMFLSYYMKVNYIFNIVIILLLVYIYKKRILEEINKIVFIFISYCLMILLLYYFSFYLVNMITYIYLSVLVACLIGGNDDESCNCR